MARKSICEEFLSGSLNGRAETEGSQGAEAYEKAPYPRNPLLRRTTHILRLDAATVAFRTLQLALWVEGPTPVQTLDRHCFG